MQVPGTATDVMTLQQDLATDFLWFIAILTALFWAGIGVAYLIRHDRIDAMPEPQPDHDEPHECNITGCHQAATHAFPTGIPNVPYYACTGHTPTVRQWAGPYDHDVPYDQQFDGTDLGRWEQEMQS
jgi:hypothetical protein